MPKDGIYAVDERTEESSNVQKRITRTSVSTKEALDVAIKQNAGPTVSPSFTWDAYTRNDTGTTDVYEYRTGGTGGSITATLTITYTDATKAAEQDVVWT